MEQMKHMAPNLFILGAARCGTTTLHLLLGQHPDIHATQIKEPTFFSWRPVVTNPLAYFTLFSSPKRYRMESSASYLPNSDTASVLRALFPDARFIVILRNPKARAYSLYRLMRLMGGETISTFSEALKAEAGRYRSRDFFLTCMFEFWPYLYTRSSLYDEQLASYFSLFDRSQFYVTSLAELSKEPIGTTERILRFLDLDPTPTKTFHFQIKNQIDGNGASYDAESDRIMTAAFEGLTSRTDRLLGHALDWSM
jgi:hypothetical protein